MTWYKKTLKNSLKKKKPVRINEFSKVAGYKINRQKFTACLYTSNKLSESEIKKTIPFMNVSKE